MANDPYPGIQQVSDERTKNALRLLWEKLNPLATQVKGPASGTLNPDRRPRLSRTDSGTKFFSTDFNREYTWNGSQWADSPTAPSRYQVITFSQTPEPAVGWILCDGRSAFISTSTGSTIYFTTPIRTSESGLFSYMRA